MVTDAAVRIALDQVECGEQAQVHEREPRLLVHLARNRLGQCLAQMLCTARAGTNAHHVAEGLFKAFARALRMAVEADPRAEGTIPSTKGMLEA